MKQVIEVIARMTGLWKFCSVLFFIFLFFKLANYGVVSTWDWLWVVAPLSGPIVLVLGVCFTVFAVAFPYHLAKECAMRLHLRRAKKRQEFFKILQEEADKSL